MSENESERERERARARAGARARVREEMRMIVMASSKLPDAHSARYTGMIIVVLMLGNNS